MDNFRKALTTYVKASIPVLSIATYEWQRLHGFCVGAAEDHYLDLFRWSVVSGLYKWDKEQRLFTIEDEENKDPVDILEWFINSDQSQCMLLLEDFQPFMTSENYQIVRLIREITRINSSLKKTLIIQTPYMVNLRELEKEVPILELELPKENVLTTILDNVLEELEYDCKPKDDYDIKDIVSASLGMSSVEAEWTYKKIIAEKERLTISEIPLIVKEKEQIIKKEGILEYFHPDSDFNQVGGMGNLKDWLGKRGKA